MRLFSKKKEKRKKEKHAPGQNLTPTYLQRIREARGPATLPGLRRASEQGKEAGREEGRHEIREADRCK